MDKSAVSKVPAPEYGYKFLDRELNRGRESQSEGLYRPASPPRQGPQQMQRQFPLSPEASSSMQYFDEADFKERKIVIRILGVSL